MHFTLRALITSTLLFLFLKVSAAQSAYSPTSTFTSELEVTPWGLFVGELDKRPWLQPYNGLYFTQDLGESWETVGLNGLGVTDLKYLDGVIYATTYYSPNGLYVSYDRGQSWQILGPQFSATAVEATQDALYYGGGSHGLWVSHDKGNFWEHKIKNPNSSFGPSIVTISANGPLALASTTNEVYISLDNGNTWQNIPYFAGKKIKKIAFFQNSIIVGGDDGIYHSKNNGTIWSKLVSWGTSPVTCLATFDNTLYAGTANILKVTQGLEGSWQPIDLNVPGDGSCLSITGLYSKPNYLFASFGTAGVHRHTLEHPPFASFPFLDLPWNAASSAELMDRVTSFFDHSYPLLGYSYFLEPQEERDSTLNFLGLKEKIPTLYYSSHNGVDFKLDYGTPVLAPAPGVASYYYCTDCGHSIKINHLNGYETTFMHLQPNQLITSSPTEQISVETGDAIGLVGMSGNTTGPHLHLSVLKIGTQYPDNLLDPFGWQSHYVADTWPLFSWVDGLGSHTGSESAYLWTYPLQNKSTHISTTDHINNENISLEFDQDELEVKHTTTLMPYKSPSKLGKLIYIAQTSFLASAIDYFGNQVTEFNSPVKISIDLSSQALEDLVLKSAKIYFLNELTNSWEALPTTLDIASSLVSAITTHFSWFAVLSQNAFSDKLAITGSRFEISL